MVVGLPQVMFAAFAAVVTMPAMAAQRVMAFMFLRWLFYVESADQFTRLSAAGFQFSSAKKIEHAVCSVTTRENTNRSRSRACPPAAPIAAAILFALPRGDSVRLEVRIQGDTLSLFEAQFNLPSLITHAAGFPELRPKSG